MRKSRQSLTKTLCDLTKKYQVDYNTAMKKWWWNSLQNGGLRLTIDGFLSLTDDIGLEYHVWKLPEPKKITPQTLLKLDQRMNSPYYIRFAGKKERDLHSVMLFAGKEATYLNIVDDLDKFLDSL